MVRALARAALTLLLVLSLAGSFWSVRQLLRNPLLSAMVSRSADGIRAATDRAMAAEATPDRIADRLRALLAETPSLRRRAVTADEVGGRAELISAEGDLRCLPCHLAEFGGMDGFFAARLERL